MVLRVWPYGQSTREMAFLQLLAAIFTAAPLLPQVDDKTRLHLRAFSRIARCLQSPHAGVAEEALMTCSNPRLIALYVGQGAPGSGAGGREVPVMIQHALAINSVSHWNADIRLESLRLREILVGAAVSSTLGHAPGDWR